MAATSSTAVVEPVCDSAQLEVTSTNTMQPRAEEKDKTEDSELSADAIERLGRERPSSFTSIWSEVAFCYSIIASQFMVSESSTTSIQRKKMLC